MHKFLVFVLFLFFISSPFTSVYSSVSTSILIEDSWSTKASMSQARSNLGVVAVDEKIYAIGGYQPRSFNVVGTNECYDPKKNTWTTLAAMSTSRSHFAIAASEGKIYCIGGLISYEGMPQSCDVTEVYDIATNSWSTKTSIPVSTSQIQACIVDGKIFVMNGRDMFMYNPVTDAWSKKTSLPVDPWSVYIYLVAWDTKIMANIVFITEDSQFHPEVMVYNTENDVWSEGKTGYAGLGKCGAVAGVTSGQYAHPRVYALGKTIFESSLLNTNQVYDPVSDTWSFAKAMLTERVGFGVAVVNDVLYVIGGYYSSSTVAESSLSLTEQYVPIGYHGTLAHDFSMVIVIVLMIGVVVTLVLFFYFLKVRKQRKTLSND